MRTLFTSLAAAFALAAFTAGCRESSDLPEVRYQGETVGQDEPQLPGQGGTQSDPGRIQTPGNIGSGGSGTEGARNPSQGAPGAISSDPHSDEVTQGQGNASPGFTGEGEPAAEEPPGTHKQRR